MVPKRECVESVCGGRQCCERNAEDRGQKHRQMERRDHSVRILAPLLNSVFEGKFEF